MATGAVSANRLEILQIANAVASEKSIDKRIVLEAMEEAIQKAARSRYGLEHDIRAEINADSGETRLWRVQTVVETVENPVTQLTLAEGKKLDPEAEIGLAEEMDGILEAIGMRGQEVARDQVFLHHGGDEGIEQVRIGSRAHGEVQVGDVGGFALARIDHDEGARRVARDLAQQHAEIGRAHV